MPVVPVFVPPQPSARARRLAGELEQTISGFRRKEPRTRDSEVRQALRLAGRRATSSGDRAAVVAIAIAVALLLAGILVFFQQSGIGERSENVGTPPWLMQAVVAGIILVVLAVVLKRRR